MASVSVRHRVTKRGRIRFQVVYRLGGRASAQRSAGTFDNQAEAFRAAALLRSQIARGQVSYGGAAERVYFASFGGSIKIGVSVDPYRRCRDLHADLLLTFPGGRVRERELHRQFAAHRRRGEWFDDTPEIREFISQYGGTPRRRRSPDAPTSEAAS